MRCTSFRFLDHMIQNSWFVSPSNPTLSFILSWVKNFRVLSKRVSVEYHEDYNGHSMSIAHLLTYPAPGKIQPKPTYGSRPCGHTRIQVDACLYKRTSMTMFSMLSSNVEMRNGRPSDPSLKYSSTWVFPWVKAKPLLLGCGLEYGNVFTDGQPSVVTVCGRCSYLV